MFTQPITFELFDGTTVTENFYFNMSKSECIDIDLKYDEFGGLLGYLKQLVQKPDGEMIPVDELPRKEMINFITSIIDASYGRKSADNRRFIKSEDDLKEFKETDAYSVLRFGLLSGDISLDSFVKGVLPQLSEEEMKRSKEILKEQGLDNVVSMM